MSFLKKGSILCICILTLLACGTKPGDGEIPPGDFSARHLVAEEYVAELDSLRSSLVQGVTGQSVDAALFAEVCKPVGLQANALSEQTGWEINQVALKYRNPSNRADEQAAAIMERFIEVPELQDVWERIVTGDRMGWRYFSPIKVEAACLACHGNKESRPDFVLDAYPEDTAFDFQVGDLRGLYTVFVPDSVNTAR